MRLLRAHVAYYNEDRPHMALDGDAPVTRNVEPPNAGRIIAFPRVGGLHHRYSRLHDRGDEFFTTTAPAVALGVAGTTTAAAAEVGSACSAR